MDAEWLNGGMFPIGIAVAWEALFTFDVLIFAMTLLKTWRQRFRYAPGVRNGIVTLMLRDGEHPRFPRPSL